MLSNRSCVRGEYVRVLRIRKATEWLCKEVIVANSESVLARLARAVQENRCEHARRRDVECR